MRFSRRGFVASSGAAFLPAGFLRFPAGAAEFEFKFGTPVPSSHPTTIRSAEAAKNIERVSGGRIRIQMFPNSELGSENAVLGQVRVGAVTFYTCNGAVLSTIVPASAMEGVAFAFSTYSQAFEAMDGPFGAHIRSAVRRAGLYTFERVWCSGFHHVINATRPVRTPDDLKGLKLRVPLSAIEVATFKALDASPLPLSITETYAGFQTHLIDGAALPLPTIESLKYYEVQKYLSLTHHLFASSTTIANSEAMQSLPRNLREAVDQSINAAGLLQRNDIIAAEDSLQKTLQSQGLAVNQPDTEPFRAVIHKAGLYEQWRAQFGDQAWSLLEKSVGQLT